MAAKTRTNMNQNLSRSVIGSLALLLVLPGAILCGVVWNPFLDAWMAIVIVISPIAAVLLAHLSLKRIHSPMGRTRGMRLAKISLLFGYAEIGLLAIVLLFPRREDRKQAYAASAVGSLRVLDTAMHAYADSHPEKGYPASLTALPSAVQGDDYESSVVRSLSDGHRSCYRFSYSARSRHSDEHFDAYEVLADPVCPGTSYLRHFFMDQTGTIRMAQGGPANAQSPTLQ